VGGGSEEFSLSAGESVCGQRLVFKKKNYTKAMYCNIDHLLGACLRERPKQPPRPAARVALLIEGFPRAHHPIVEFAELLFLLRAHGAKATFVVDWHEIRERGLTSRVAEMMKLLKHNEHEVAIKFKRVPCGAHQLSQHAVEALHFLQRVYNITAVSAKVGCCVSQEVKRALGTLGVTVVDAVPNQIVVQDTEGVLVDVDVVLRRCVDKECVCVSRVARSSA